MLVNHNTQHSLDPREVPSFWLHQRSKFAWVFGAELPPPSSELLHVSVQLRRMIAKILFLLTPYIFTGLSQSFLCSSGTHSKKPEMEVGRSKAGYTCNKNMLPKQESVYAVCLIYQHHSFISSSVKMHSFTSFSFSNVSYAFVC